MKDFLQNLNCCPFCQRQLSGGNFSCLTSSRYHCQTHNISSSEDYASFWVWRDKKSNLNDLIVVRFGFGNSFPNETDKICKIEFFLNLNKTNIQYNMPHSDTYCKTLVLPFLLEVDWTNKEKFRNKIKTILIFS